MGVPGQFFDSQILDGFLATIILDGFLTTWILEWVSTVLVSGKFCHSEILEQFSIVWILERFMTVGVPGQFFHFRDFRAVFSFWILERVLTGGTRTSFPFQDFSTHNCTAVLGDSLTAIINCQRKTNYAILEFNACIEHYYFTIITSTIQKMIPGLRSIILSEMRN